MATLAKLTALVKAARVPWAGASLCAVSEAPAGGGREQGDRAETAGAEGRRGAQRHEGAGRRQRSGGHAARERADAGDRVCTAVRVFDCVPGRGQARGRQGDGRGRRARVADEHSEASARAGARGLQARGVGFLFLL